MILLVLLIKYKRCNFQTYNFLANPKPKYSSIASLFKLTICGMYLLIFHYIPEPIFLDFFLPEGKLF